MPTVTEMLNELKERGEKTPLTDEIRKSIETIVEICDTKYNNVGATAALYRKILLDPEIAELLTEDVITYLFTNPKPEAKDEDPAFAFRKFRNGKSEISAAIAEAFSNGYNSVRLLPDTDSDYNATEQQNAFNDNTKKIISNICKSAKKNIKDLTDEPKRLTGEEMIQAFEQYVLTVNYLKNSKNPNFINELGNMTAEIRFEDALDTIAKKPPPISIKNMSLDELCERLLTSPPEGLFLGDQTISKLFLPMNIERSLAQDTKFSIGGEEYTFEDIFRAMITKVANNPKKYPSAKEQLDLRMFLVEKELTRDYPYAYQQTRIQSISDAFNEYKDHLKTKLKEAGLTKIPKEDIEMKTLLEKHKDTPTENLIRRYRAIVHLQAELKDENNLAHAIGQAKTVLHKCVDLKPDWSEKPFLSKLTDILSLGIKPIYKAFFSKEANLEKTVEKHSKPGLGG